MDGVDGSSAFDLDDLDRPPRWEPEPVLPRRTTDDTLRAAALAFVAFSAVIVVGAPFLGTFAGPVVLVAGVTGLGYVGWFLSDELKPVALLTLVALLVGALPFL